MFFILCRRLNTYKHNNSIIEYNMIYYNIVYYVDCDSDDRFDNKRS